MLYPSSAPTQTIIVVGEGVPFKSRNGGVFNRGTYHALRIASEMKAAGGKVGSSQLLLSHSKPVIFPRPPSRIPAREPTATARRRWPPFTFPAAG